MSIGCGKGDFGDRQRESVAVSSADAKWLCRHIPQEACPWNAKFATAMPEPSPFAARNAIAVKDARTLPRDILQMTQEEFGPALRGSPM